MICFRSLDPGSVSQVPFIDTPKLFSESRNSDKRVVCIFVTHTTWFTEKYIQGQDVKILKYPSLTLLLHPFTLPSDYGPSNKHYLGRYSSPITTPLFWTVLSLVFNIPCLNSINKDRYFYPLIHLTDRDNQLWRNDITNCIVIT